jgi:hypothetical protein
MWTSDNRGQYDRDKLHYPSDVIDAEWEHIASLIPPAKRVPSVPMMMRQRRAGTLPLRA